MTCVTVQLALVAAG